MENYISTYERLNKWVKVILCLLYAIPEGLYRLFRSIKMKDTLGIVLAVVLMLFGGWILFVVDIVTLIAMDKILWFDKNITPEEEEAPAEEAEQEAPKADEEKAE